MKKLRDYDEKIQESIKDEFVSEALLVYDCDGGGTSGDFSEYGLCASCSSLTLVKSQFRVRVAACGAFGLGKYRIRLDSSDPIIVCSGYTKRGELSLHEMYNMAYFIDVKRPIGFQQEDE